MDALTFANTLIAKGIELALRKNGRLWLWPKNAYSRLTDTEREFYRAHHAELLALVQTGVQPKLADDAVAGHKDALAHPDFRRPATLPVLRPAPVRRN